MVDGRRGVGDSSDGAPVRLAELLGSLSLATDAANDFPPQKAMRTCLVAVELGRCLDLPESELVSVYWAGLLRFLGCTGFSHEEANRYGGGDDHALKQVMAFVEFAERPAGLARIVTGVGATAPLPRRVRAVASLMADPAAPSKHASAACDAAHHLAGRLRMDEGVVRVLGEAFEWWNGKGLPDGRSGDELAVATRVVQAADAAGRGFQRRGGQGAIETITRQSGKALDPTVAATFLDHSGDLLPLLDEGSVWDRLLEAEPGPPVCVPSSRMDEVADAFARFADLKSTWTLGHSIDVAALAGEAASAAHLGPDQVRLVTRAGLLHDIGRTAVSNRIWDKPGLLDRAERDLAEMHAYQTQRILRFTPLLDDVAAIASTTHERADGSGYPKGTASPHIGLTGGILAAADVYVALTSARPHRPPWTRDQAVGHLSEAASDRRLDRRAVAAILAVAGEGAVRRLPNPGRLSDREVEVVGMLARGGSNKDIARQLGITAKTVAHHVAHIYDKLGVRSRAGVALYAVEHGLV